jgi:DNA-binding response OmpR family regulator
MTNALLEPPIQETARESAHTLATEPPGPLTALPARVLYVDDDPQIKGFAKLVLCRSGYVVDTAADGAEAWAALRDSEYDLLVTDYQMPRLNGLELIRKVQLANMKMPVILVSSLVGSSSDNDPLWQECSGMLGKPFTASQLVSVVQEVLHVAAPTQV